MQDLTTFETGCCPRFDPALWQEKEIVFDEKLFLKDHVTSLFHIPLNFGTVIERDTKKIKKAHAEAEEQLVLSDEKSLWGSDLYIAVGKEVPDAEMERISGTFLTKAFEGPYSQIGKYSKEMLAYAESKGEKAGKLYYHYAYCPSCAKAYGNSYTVVFAQVA